MCNTYIKITRFLFAPIRGREIRSDALTVGSALPACMRTQASYTHGYLKFAPIRGREIQNDFLTVGSAALHPRLFEIRPHSGTENFE